MSLFDSRNVTINGADDKETICPCEKCANQIEAMSLAAAAVIQATGVAACSTQKFSSIKSKIIGQARTGSSTIHLSAYTYLTMYTYKVR